MCLPYIYGSEKKACYLLETIPARCLCSPYCFHNKQVLFPPYSTDESLKLTNILTYLRLSSNFSRLLQAYEEVFDKSVGSTELTDE